MRSARLTELRSRPELLPTQLLGKLKIGDAVKYRKESESARDAFLEHLAVLQTRLGEVPLDGDYTASISKIITTEIRPAAREFRGKLDAICERLFGKIVGPQLQVPAPQWHGPVHMPQSRC
jgi:hypothetical protein